MTSNKIKDNIRIKCEYINSNSKFISLHGRFPCMALYKSGHIVVFDGVYWTKIKINQKRIKRVRDIAIRDKGSLYINLRPSGVGYILDEKLHDNS